MIERWRHSRADKYTELPSATASKTDLEPTSKKNEDTDASTSRPSTKVDENPTPVDESPPPVQESPPPLGKLPSWSTLESAMSNYPPLWSKDSTPKTRPLPRETKSEGNAGASVASLNAVLSTSCSQEDKKKFQERDPSNRHDYVQYPNKSRYASHARMNVFGADIGPMGKAPPLFSGGGWGIGKKKK